ncbi:MAG: LacI family DNA-binding transcriptional regulator [Cyclobacteriaceae bacterium]|nr:LacI family DNA-binding transcriptional regulator [Cyclobacteriaceae bacterium]UYN85768.1 MAG: LacI family DNA-binding transcriptional regulator [Cyclobacteriaceae bacterium]
MTHHKEVTIYDIAEALNVSPATVSRGLKDHPGLRKDTKRKILDTAKKMGYQYNTFASNLRRKKTNTIGVIVPRLNSYFMSTVIAGMEKLVNENGYNLIISQSQESFKKEIAGVNTMYNSRIDGLMVSLAYDTKDTEHFQALLTKNIPIIFFDRILEHAGCTSIVIDNHQAGYDATKHLLDQGCKRIVHLSGSLNRNVYADRLDGYKQALQERGIAFDPELVISNNLSDMGGEEAARQILEMNERPDGVFAANDTSAVACMRELKLAGIRIPEDIAFVGFNNDPVSKVIEPNLTTVNYPGQEMGEVAAATLLNKLNKSNTANLNTIVLRHELIIRQSSLKK